MSIIGFIVGAICAVIFYVVADALLPHFDHKDLLLALVAILIWLAGTFGWDRANLRV